MNHSVSSRVISLLTISALIALMTNPLLAAFEKNASRSLKIDLTQTSSTSTSLKIELGDLVRQDISHMGEQFERFPIEDQPTAGPIGRPDLSPLVKFMLIPPESGVSVRIKNLRTHLVQNVNPIPRQPEPLEKNIESTESYELMQSTSPLVMDDEFYATNSFWPEENVTLSEPQIMRGYRILPVRINPLRYNPVTKVLEVVDEIELEFDFPSDENRTNLVENPNKARPSASVEKLLKGLVINPPSTPIRDNPIHGGSILYVLGAGNGWNAVMDGLTPLIEWRRKMGWTVGTLRVNNPSDANSARQAIQAYYRDAENPPEHIVICGDTNGEFAFMYFNHQDGAGYPYESDHDFGMIEGNDILPEASVGRLLFNSANRLRDIVSKTIAYESDPFLGEGNAAGWQTRGAVESVTSRSGISANDMCRWSKIEMIRNGYTRVNELYWEQAGVDRDNRQFVFDNINGGVSVFLHRGYLWMGTFAFGDVQQLRNGRMLPFVLAITCNTGDYGEAISDGGNGYFNESFCFHPSGAIGAIGCAGATHTAYNNIYCTETIRSFVSNGIQTQGWANEAGKLALYTHYFDRGDIMHEENRNVEAWLTELYITNLMGDPAVDLFTAVPRRLAVTPPNAIRKGETSVEVTVLHDDDDSPARDANVCLYKRGVLQMVKNPDADGKVAFALNPAWAQQDSIHLTITGHNLLTWRRFYIIGQAQDFVGASTFEIDDNQNGNGDSEANQLETIALTVNVANLGANDYDGQLTLNIASSDPNLDVVEGDVVLEQVPAHGEAAAATFLVRIGGGFQSGVNAVFDLTATVGDHSWVSSVSVPVSGPDLEFVSLDWEEDQLHRAESAELSITVKNIGTGDLSASRATFFSRVRTIGPVVAGADFGAIAVGRSVESGSNFRLSAHPFHIGNKPIPVGLAIVADNGFIDTVLFDLQISPAVAGEPFGPDDYAYICFDNLDTTWFAYPEYNWIEIDPQHDGEGRNTNLADGGDSQDRSVVVDLPFNFQYYGEDFDGITICSNGWISMGDSRALISARNRHIPGGECPPGLIAPFWEELIIPQNGGVYTWYDEENHQFIVEWSRLKKLGPRGNDEPVETFQVILQDSDHYPSFTGDGNIIFQYNDVTDNSSCFQEYDTPFASVGISSPDNKTGLEYVYWNEYPGGAARLADGRAIKFTTLVEFVTGSLAGRVTDAATGEPIDSAIVYTTFGFSAMTDENGDFQIPDMLVDSTYEFTATKLFYNDSTIAGEIIEGQETYVEFAMLHPEFSLSNESANFTMLSDSVANGVLMLQNTGNGLMSFTSRYGYEIERDDPDDAWDLLRRWDWSDSLDSPRLQSVAYVKDHWLVGATRIERDDPHIFYTFDREGNSTGQFIQRDSLGGAFGIQNMTYDNGNLWAVASDINLYQLDPDSGYVIGQWSAFELRDRVRCLALDSESGSFYAGGITSPIYKAEFVGDSLTITDSFSPLDPRDNSSLKKYGFSWFPDDPDGYPLYIVGINEVPEEDDNHPDLSIFKVNPATNQVIFVTDLAQHLTPNAGGRCGMTITHDWSNRLYALAIIVEVAAHDWLGIFEIAPNTSWVSYEPKEGTLEAGDQLPIEIEVESTGLDSGLFEIMIDFTHNAAPGFQRFPVQMEVVSELPQFDLISPADGDTVELWLLRTDSVYANAVRFVWEEPHPADEEENFNYTIWFQMGDSMTHYETADTFLAVSLDTVWAAEGEMTWWVEAASESGIYTCRTPFHLRVIALSVNSDPTVPIEFGLHAIYPIPFNSRLTISFGIDVAEPARLAMYDMLGREVTRLFDGTPKIGNYKAVWDAGRYSSGVYVVRLESVGRVKVAKVVMVK